MLSFVKILILSITTLSYATQPVVTGKPDLQKVYNEALAWSKTKLEAMPNPGAAVTETTSKVCHGSKNPKVLPITPGCKRKPQQEMNEVLDQVITEESGTQGVDKILVFVSFSMPTASLVALSQSAEKHHAVLVMRGLKNDSFKETQVSFAALGKDMTSGVEINPEAFETYQIKQVPVFVRVKSMPGKVLQELGRLSGNVSLAFAANKLKEPM